MNIPAARVTLTLTIHGRLALYHVTELHNQWCIVKCWREGVKFPPIRANLGQSDASFYFSHFRMPILRASKTLKFDAEMSLVASISDNFLHTYLVLNNQVKCFHPLRHVLGIRSSM